MKKSVILLTVSAFSLLINEAKAQLVVDFGAIAGQVTNWVTQVSENATKVVKPISEQYETIKKGIKGAQEACDVVNQAKEKYEAGKKKIEEAKAKYEEVKGGVDKAKSTAETAKGKVDSAKSTLEDTAQKAQEAKEQADAKTQYLSAQEELDEKIKEREKYIEDETARYKANIEALQYNNKIYIQKIEEDEEAASSLVESFYKKSIEENEEAIVQMQEEIKKITESENVESFDEDIAEKLKASIEALQYDNEIYSQKMKEEEEQAKEAKEERVDGFLGVSGYKANIEENEKAIAQMEEEIKKIPESETVKALDDDIAAKKEALEERKKELEATAEKAKGDAKAKAAVYGAAAGAMVVSALGGLLGGGGQEYAKAAADNFVPEGEAAGGELMSEMAQKRREQAAKDTIDAYIVALEIKQQLADNNKMVQDLNEDMAEVEDSKSSILTETSGIKIKTMKNILDFVKLQIAELKMETSLDMLSAPMEVKVKDSFNFDDYVFTQEDATGEAEKSWLEKVKSAKKGAEETIADTKKGVENAKKTAEDVKKQGEGLVKDGKSIADDVSGENK